MARAANDVMQSIIFGAVLEGIAALKRASGGLPNQLLRDVQAIHANVTFADLAKELQDMGYVLQKQGFNGDIQAIKINGDAPEPAADPRGRGVTRVVK